MISLTTANSLVEAALDYGESANLKPLSVVVLDQRGSRKAEQSQDGTSLLRSEIAYGKAYGALALGVGSRAIFERAEAQPYFVGAVNGLAGGALVPVPGGLLVRDAHGTLLGAIGISGDTSDNDEAAAIHAIGQAGLIPVRGEA